LFVFMAMQVTLDSALKRIMLCDFLVVRPQMHQVFINLRR